MDSTGKRLLEFAFVAFLLIGLVSLLIPETHDHRDGPRGPQCKNNLKQIGLALWNYHDQHGSFPPAYIADKDGQPMLSWRVMLLPFLDHAELYAEYRFDEPWDGPHNRQLWNRISTSSNVYHCPQNAARDDGGTSYVAVVGPNTAWPGIQGTVRDRDFPKGTDKTVMLVEIADSGIHWMEPGDLSFDEMNVALNDQRGNSPSVRHSEKGRWPWSPRIDTVHVLFADGHVEALPVETAAETLRELLTARKPVE